MPTDAELRDQAVAELKLTTTGYVSTRTCKHTWTIPPAGTHWANALDLLAQIGVTPPPPPPTGKLPWSPPALTTPTSINVTQTNRSFSLNNGQDYILHMPSTPILSDNSTGLTVIGGRNVVVIGGEIANNTPDNTNNGTAQSGNHYGLYIVRNTGTVHVEGMWIHGQGLGQAIIIQNTLQGVTTTVQAQNCRLETLNPVNTNGIHTDGIQVIAGPTYLRQYRMTTYSTGTAMQTQPHNGSDWTGFGDAVGPWEYRSLDWIAQQPDTNTNPQSYGLWKGSGTGKWAEVHTDIYYHNNPNHIWGAPPVYSTWADHNDYGGWNPGGDWPITGEAINIGLRPGGDLVPASTIGVGYVSPGYA